MKNTDITGQMIKLYKNGMTMTQIGQELGFSQAGVFYRLKQAGVSRGGQSKCVAMSSTRQMIELYQNGRALEEIGRRFGITKQGVRYRLQQSGILYTEKYKDIDKNRLTKFYHEDKMSILKIAQMFSVSESTIYRSLTFHKIAKRDRIKNGGDKINFLRSLEIGEKRVFQYRGSDDNARLHGQANRIGIKIKMKKITSFEFEVTRIE